MTHYHLDAGDKDWFWRLAEVYFNERNPYITLVDEVNLKFNKCKNHYISGLSTGSGSQL